MVSGRQLVGRQACGAPDGLPVPDLPKLLQQIRTGLQRALNKAFVRSEQHPQGVRETCYFCEPIKASVGGGEKQLPAINIHEGITSIWLVVELVTERDQGVYSIHHVSLKVLEGI